MKMHRCRNALAVIAATCSIVACDRTPSPITSPKSPAQALTADAVPGGFAIDLGTLGGSEYTMWASSINDYGIALGMADDGTWYRSWISVNGARMTHGPQLWDDNMLAEPTAMNNSGDITGWRQNSQGCCVAFLAVPAQPVTELPTPSFASSSGASRHSEGHAINSAGDVAGYFETATGADAALWPKGGALIDLGTHGARASFANGMNDNDEVVGHLLMADGSYDAFYWSAATGIVDIGPGNAMDINNHGVVVGESSTGGFLWTKADGRRPITVPPGVASITPLTINDQGVFAGACDEGRSHACAGTDQGIFYISDEGELSSRITSINNENVALGTLDMPDGKYEHAVEWRLTAPDADHAPVISMGGPYSGHAGSALALSWNASDADNDPLTYTWDFGDGTAGSGAVLPATHVWAAKGTYTLTLGASDGRGGTGSETASVTVGDPLDTTAPAITPTITGTLGRDGWYTSNVVLAWSESDVESGVAKTSGCNPVTVSSNTAGASFTCSATNGAGLTARRTETIKRDDSTPTVTPTIGGTMGQNGWYTSDVSVAWGVTANGPSGAAPSADCATTAITSDTPLMTLHCTGTTGAGLGRTGTVSLKRDATPPAVGYSGNAATYTVDQTVAITCTASDALSGLASSTCRNVSGDAYAFGVGTHTYSATASDLAGNTAQATTSFVVRVTFESLSSLTQRWVTNAGVASSLEGKLADAASGDAGALQAYIHEVEAQSGKHIPADKAALLESLAGAL